MLHRTIIRGREEVVEIIKLMRVIDGLRGDLEYRSMTIQRRPIECCLGISCATVYQIVMLHDIASDCVPNHDIF